MNKQDKQKLVDTDVCWLPEEAGGQEWWVIKVKGVKYKVTGGDLPLGGKQTM